MTKQINMHGARMSLNRNPDMRDWAEGWLKNKERETYFQQPDATEETFARHWLYVRPERMHESAIEAVVAYHEQHAGEG